MISDEAMKFHVEVEIPAEMKLNVDFFKLRKLSFGEERFEVSIVIVSDATYLQNGCIQIKILHEHITNR